MSNRLIAHLDAEIRERLTSAGDTVALKKKFVVIDIDRPIEHVYFPIDSVISVVAATRAGVAIETATVGCEGMVGLPLFLGSDRTTSQAFCQVSGTALRLSADAFREQLSQSDELRAALGTYTLAFITQTAQTSACNRLHTMRERCARWLLETHDRVARPTFDLTQEFLSEMLGVRRATVSEVATALQRDGLISYEYRRITVLDRSGLEAAACDCYRIIKREYDRLIEGRSTQTVFANVRTSVDAQTTLEPPAAPQSDVLE
jgi:CRP-like cAMP-binding protein